MSLLPVVGMLGGATKLVGGGIAELSRANVAERRLLKSDTDALEKNQLGYSDARKTQLQNEALANAQNASQSAQDAAGRAKSAGQLSEAAYGKTLGNIASGAQATASGAGMGILQQSDQVAEGRRANILGRISQKAQQNRGAAQQMGADVGETVKGYAAGKSSNPYDALSGANSFGRTA